MTATPERTAGYLAAQKQSDDLRRADRIAASNYRVMAVVASAVSVVSLCLVAFMLVTSRHRIIPYVIGVDELGRAQFAGLATEQRANDPRLNRATMYNWVDKWRMVTSDWNAQSKAITDVVFAHVAEGSPARTAIEAWYRAAPPQERVKNGVVSVEVKSVLATSEKSYEVEWIERTWANGSMKSEEHWRGSFGVAISTPGDERQAYLNPLGLYITEASWTKVL